MTKESILDEHVKYAWECDQASPVVPYSAAEKAMDEYAKQHAIEFFCFFTGATSTSDPHILKRYNQFIEQQNKDNG